MFSPTKVQDVELAEPLATVEGLHGYGALQLLVRLHGAPLGYVTLPLVDGRCTAAAQAKAIVARHGPGILAHLVADALATPPPSRGLRLDDVLHAPHPAYTGPLPAITVAVCTRDRPDDLARCLGALTALDYPALDLLVVDNAPSTTAVADLVRTRFPGVRYVHEPRPGLDWARNRAIREARGEIVAFTDDDVVVDRRWARALGTVFAEDPEVMAVTGLVVPLELETEAQVLFERYGGFGRGFTRTWHRMDGARGERFPYHGAGHFGTGANMAFRRALFARIGEFDPALDVGTVTNGGGDLEMFFRVLKEGHTLVYEPSAIVRHRHRREQAELLAQITNNGTALVSYFVRSALAYPEERSAFLRFWSWWLWWRYLRLLVRPRLPPDIRTLLSAEGRALCTGIGRFPRARREAAEIAHRFGGSAAPPAPTRAPPDGTRACAVRRVELSAPLAPLLDVDGHTDVRVFVTWQDRPIGSVDIPNRRRAVGVLRLREAIATTLAVAVVDPLGGEDLVTRWARAEAALARHVGSSEEVPPEVPVRAVLPSALPVSIVVATRNRPDDLRRCLRCLTTQVTPRPVEIVVADNDPASGLTAPVVAEFPRVVLVAEPRRGVSYARNAAIAASRGALVVTVDDDVTMPSDWLEKLLAPFTRAEVMAVTGNVLPVRLDTAAQRLFETYGGLGRGYVPRTYGREWFDGFRTAVPTWDLGGTANAAFRARLFADPEVGLMDEALGPGMPSGVGEDTYLFYRILKANLAIHYEPGAYVWHNHREDLPALRRQLYGYSKGHVAYHLTTLLRDRDLRALVRLGLRLPQCQLRRLVAGLLGRGEFPLSLLLAEITGNLVGPVALWRSRRRVERNGRSAPYVPPSSRLETGEGAGWEAGRRPGELLAGTERA